MDMSGEYRIPAPRQSVWEALNDPAILKQAITGCESLERVGDNQFTASVVAKVGPVKAKFGGKVTLSDLDPPNGYTISGEGAGGAAGFAKGGAQVHLYDTDDGGTILRYEAKADVGGKLAQIGSRLIQGTAKKMADDFFAKFGELVAAGSPGSAPPPVAAAAEPAPAAGIAPSVAAEPVVAAAATTVEAGSGAPAAAPGSVEVAATPAQPAAAPQAAPTPPAPPVQPVTPAAPAYRPPPPAPAPVAAAKSGPNLTLWVVVGAIILLLLIWGLA